MALVLPFTVYRIDSMLIALEACSLLDLDIKPRLALEAVTKNIENTNENEQQQGVFQPGASNNYERMEFLGDAFLKMATTISLFTEKPDKSEYEYHVLRMTIICNQNLFNHAIARNLQEYIRCRAVSRRSWYPDMKLIRGKGPDNKPNHFLDDKTIADVCEALIGAAYLSGRDGDMDAAVMAVTKMVKSKDHKMLKFADYYAKFNVPAWQTSSSTAAQRNAVEKVAGAIGYTFQHPPLLRCAFKHPSYPYESIPNYQRLEFLGDSLLDLAIADFLIKRFTWADPQWLTEHKMAMASNHFLGSLCVQLGLHKHILSSQSVIISQITGYTRELEHAKEAAYLKAATGEAPMRKDFWLNTRLPPKALADVLEAMVGAMFVDSKYDYGVVQRFFDVHVLPYFEDMALYDTYASRHPVTALFHRVQETMGCTLTHLLVDSVPAPVEAGAAALKDQDVACALMVHDTMMHCVIAKSGTEAKYEVAKKGLETFADMDAQKFRAATGCDCKCVPVKAASNQPEQEKIRSR